MQTSHELWPAPRAATPVRATIAMPGSKSVMARALVLAALADGPSTLQAPLRSRDSLLMAAALRALGVAVDAQEGDAWRVTPGRLHGPAAIDCGLAGTVMRFVPPMAAIADGRIEFDGDPRARERPMGRLITALRSLGATIDDDGREALPFAIAGTGALAGGRVVIDASASSQFVSALLLSGARYDNGVTVVHEGGPVPSLPHIEMTVAMLRTAGVAVDDSTKNTWIVSPGPVVAADRVIEPDLSNAAPFLAAAMVAGGSVTVPNWPSQTTQPGDALRDLFAQMGATVSLEGGELTVAAGDRLSGLDADLHDVGELTPVLAALCALADSPSQLRGVAHLRGHETDRLAALAKELNALGGDVTETADGLEIRPRKLHGSVFASYDDHRMAQAGALIGLAVDGVTVENIAATTKTLPDFPGMWAQLLGAGAAPGGSD